MKKIIYVLLISCFSLTIIYCFSGGSKNQSQSQCTSEITFQKNIFGKQAKQTNDCGYIVAYNGKLTKLDNFGEAKWESEITLDQKNIAL